MNIRHRKLYTYEKGAGIYPTPSSVTLGFDLRKSLFLTQFLPVHSMPAHIV